MDRARLAPFARQHVGLHDPPSPFLQFPFNIRLIHGLHNKLRDRNLESSRKLLKENQFADFCAHLDSSLATDDLKSIHCIHA
jgi:hypothetical protein